MLIQLAYSGADFTGKMPFALDFGEAGTNNNG